MIKLKWNEDTSKDKIKGPLYFFQMCDIQRAKKARLWDVL